MSSFLTFQKELDKLPSLYLENYKSEYSFSEWDMKDFILQLLVSLSESNNTMLSTTGAKDCKPSKRRSIGDIYRLCKYYYDNVTLHEVQYWLSVLWREKKVGYFYCNSTKKRVYMSMDFYKTHSVNPVSYGSPDEYGIKPSEITSLANKNLTF